MNTVKFTLEYWKDGAWYVGQLVEVPGIMSQGATLKELEENIQDAYHLMLEDRKREFSQPRSRAKSIPIAVHA